MLTSHKFHLLQLFTVFFLLFSSLISYGQWGDIIKIEKDGKTLETIEIEIVKKDGVKQNLLINIKTSSKKATRIDNGTIIILKPKTIIGIKSTNTNELYIESDKNEKIVEYLVSNYRELYRSMNDNDSGNLIAKVFKPLVGDIKTANIDNTFNGAADGTHWVVSNDGENLNFKILEGKVKISGRSKIEMDDNIIKLEGENKRVLYITEIIDHLTPKDSIVAFNPESLIKKPLTTEKEIDEFLRIESKKHTKLLKSSGQYSKSGFKLLGQGLYKEGIAEYEKAIELGEIDMERFIQASLILTEATHEINTNENLANKGFQSPKIKQNIDTWLEASLHFIKKTDSVSNAKFEIFKNNEHKNIAKAYGYDLVLSKEYLAWAYTVKLKLKGCLENTEQNPLVLMKEASKLKDTLKTY